MKDGIIRRLTLLAAFLCASAWALPVVLAEERDDRPVKVGYYEDGDYMSRNQQGEYAGYNIEFLQELSKQSGLKYEIVDGGSWTSTYDMLLSGEIDLLPAVYYTDERAEDVLFAAQPMCSIYTTLNVRMDDERYTYEEFEAFDGMKVGIIRGGVDGDRFKEFCREHEVTLDIIEFDETGELLAALDDGTLDGVAITHLGNSGRGDRGIQRCHSQHLSIYR